MKSGINLLTHPFNQEEFTTEFYEKKWHHFDNRLQEFKTLFSFNDLEEYLFISRPWNNNNNDNNEIRCAKFPAKSFSPEISSMEELLELYADGHTLILNSVHLRWPALAKFCSQLSNDFFCRVSANIYVTPPNNRGFQAHYDSHDVFIVQTVGAKKWQLNNIEKLPLLLHDDRLRNEFYTIDPVEDMKDAKSILLEAGERLYIPRGTIHSAEGLSDEPSIHITFSFFPITWYELLRASMLDGSLKNTELMRTVPFEVLENLSAETSISKLNEMFNLAFSEADLDAVWRFIYDRNNALLPGGGIDSILNIEKIDENTLVTIRDGADIFIDSHKSATWVSFSGRRIPIPDASIDYFYYLMENSSYTVNQLPGDASNLDSKIVFTKWLINKGLATTSISRD